MSLVINNNMMAANTARNLGESYGRLATSVQRLSTGMRINSAADDAAGLAIRETMRAEIAALNQGIRNAQDGISMIQTAEGALAVIDEKLIRMKELAEQAATGTYTSAQRLIIHSEFSAMAAEIDRIAESTEFNGIKLLNGASSSAGYQGGWSANNTWVANAADNADGTIIAEGEDGSGLWTNNSGWTETNGLADENGDIHGGIKVHFGTTNQRAEDYYFVRMADSRTESLFRAANPEDPSVEPETLLLQGATDTETGHVGANDMLQEFYNEGIETIQLKTDALYGPGNNITTHAGGYLAAGSVLTEGTDIALTHGQEIVIDGTSYTYLERGFNADGQYSLEGERSTHTWGGLVTTDSFKSGTIGSEFRDDGTRIAGADFTILAAGEIGPNGIDPTVVGTGGTHTLTTMADPAGDPGDTLPVLQFNFTPKVDGDTAGIGTLTVANGTFTLENAVKFEETDTLGADTLLKAGSVLNLGHVDGNPADPENDPDGPALTINEVCHGIEIVGHSFAQSSLDTSGAAANGSTFGVPFERGALPSLLSQHSAQDALEHIDTAILRKENIRASLGAIQNRLENTITNLSIQAENLQASESRISDVDIANEMTEFVRNQVLTQAAVAMLGQANSLPQMALRLLG